MNELMSEPKKNPNIFILNAYIKPRMSVVILILNNFK